MCAKCQDYRATEYAVYQIVESKPFVHAVVSIHLSKQYPRDFPCNKMLLTPKYEVPLMTNALNELLGRPAPRVIYLGAVMAAAKNGDFEQLDATLGIDSNGELEPWELEKQVKMNNIMKNIVKARIGDFDEIVAVTTQICLDGIDYLDKNYSNEKTNKVRKMKAKHQRKLEKIEPSQSNANEKSDEKVSNNSGKSKTAKDFEHYRKTKKPTRI